MHTDSLYLQLKQDPLYGGKIPYNAEPSTLTLYATSATPTALRSA